MLTYADACSLVCVFKAPSSAAYDVGKIRSLEAHININLLDYCQHTLRQHMTKRLVNYLHPTAGDATQAVMGGVDLESTCPIPVRSLPGQHTSAYVSIRQHTHTSAYVSIRREYVSDSCALAASARQS